MRFLPDPICGRYLLLFVATPAHVVINVRIVAIYWNQKKLIDPKSKIDGSIPELRETEHFYLDLSGLQEDIIAFLKTREPYWRSNVMRQSLGQILTDGLHGRAITRDLDWGNSCTS